MLLRRSVLLFFTAALASTTLAPRADASVSVALSLDDLARSSAMVARVTAVDRSSRWEDGRIVTYTRVRIDDPVAGAAMRGSELSVRTLGGIVDGVGQAVEGEARLATGASSLLFLTEREGHTVVTGRAQGQLAIVRRADGREVVRTVPAGALVVRAPSRLPAALEGRDASDARAEIVRAWEATHAR